MLAVVVVPVLALALVLGVVPVLVVVAIDTSNYTVSTFIVATDQPTS